MGKLSLSELLRHLNAGKPLLGGTPEFFTMMEYSDAARRVTGALNSGYHSPEEIRMFMTEIVGSQVPESFRLFPPFYTDFGKNIHIGERVFINCCCCFQDQGGIWLDDDCFIGHQVVIATINHGLLPEDRFNNHVAPVRLGKKVWIGSGAIILPGVRIGDNAIVGAGSVVTRDVEPGTVVAGNPAAFIKNAAGRQ